MPLGVHKGLIAMGLRADIKTHGVRAVVERGGTGWECFFLRLDPPRDRVGETHQVSTEVEGRQFMAQRARDLTGDPFFELEWEQTL